MSAFAGVDVGSTETKAVVLDGDGALLGTACLATGADLADAARRSLEEARERAGVSARALAFTVGTGYGRFRVAAGDLQVSEISCHARGARHLLPGARTVLDMGGHDTKAIRVGDRGEVLDFCMNDKCAAGTGRFLEAAAAALGLRLDQLGARALRARRAVPISTTCTVFAEAEVLCWVGRGRPIGEVLRGVHEAIASRAVSLLARVGVEPEVALTGGVARNRAMVAALEAALGRRLLVSPSAQLAGAIGAALFAREAHAAGGPR